MSGKTIDFAVDVAVNQKDIGDLSKMEERLKALISTYKIYLDLVQQGEISLGSKIKFGDTVYTPKQLEHEAQYLKRTLGEAGKALSENSFGDILKEFDKNLNSWHKKMQLYNKINNPNSDEAKRLFESAKQDVIKNNSIQESMFGIYDFKARTRRFLDDKANEEVLNAPLGELKKQARQRAVLNKQISESVTSQALTTRTQMGLISLAYQNNKITAEQYGTTMDKLEQKYRRLGKVMEDVKNRTEQSDFNKFTKSIKSHLHWMISGSLVDKLYEIPMAIKEISVEFDNLERKIAQNIELSGQFEHQPDKLKNAARDLTHSSLMLANYHGMKISDAMEMMQIMSRRFKDPAELKYYTDLAMTLSKLDFVSPAVAAESLESVILSFNLTARETKDFVNEFSVATHTMRINGQDLLEALQRSAPVLKQWGMSTAESVALISTLSTTLGREGKYIGTAITGMFSRLVNKKNYNFFNEIGISMSKANGEMKTGIEILREYSDHYNKLDEVSRNRELNKIFGTHRLVPGTSTMKTFDLLLKTIDDIKSKASDATTAQLESMQIESHESKINRFNNTLQFLAFCIGDVVAPTVTFFLEIITDMIVKLVEWDRENIFLIKTLVEMIAVFGGYAGGLKIINAIMGKHCTLLSLSSFLTAEHSDKAKDAAKSNRIFGESFNTLTKRLGTFALRLATTLGVLYAAYYLITKSMDLIEEGETNRQVQNYLEEIGGSQNLDPKNPKEAAIIRYLNESGNYHRMKKEFAIRTQASNEINDANYYSNTSNTELGRKTSDEQLTKSIRKQKRELDDATRAVSLAFSPEEEESRTKGDLWVESIKEQLKRAGDNTERPFADKPQGTEHTNDLESEEDKKFDKGTKMALDSKTSKFKTDEEVAKKQFESSMKDIEYEESLFGKTPKIIASKLNLRANRNKDLLSQYNEIKKESESLNKKIADIKDKDPNAETINDKGETTNNGKLLATYSKANDDLRKLLAENQKLRAELSREMRKEYEISFDKHIEEEKKRIDTEEKLDLLRATNKRNAWNYMLKNNVELEHERKRSQLLGLDYRVAENERKLKQKDLEDILQNSEALIKEYGEEVYLILVKDAEREVQLAKDKEQEKLLALEESKQKIMDLEDKQTEKIREGLHGIVQDLLLEGKSLKDIWNKLWTDLAEEALRALMRIEGGQQSTLGALAANLSGLDGGGGKGGGKAKAAQGKGGKAKAASVAASAYGGNTLGLEYAGGWISHDGSIIGVTPLNTRYYHNGGNVGTSVVPYLKSDEVNAVLQTGEEVVSRKDRRSNELMSEQNKHMADAMQRMAEGSNTNVTFAIQAIDSKSVVQLLSENGDAIMNILRKQSAYGNGRI